MLLTWLPTCVVQHMFQLVVVVIKCIKFLLDLGEGKIKDGGNKVQLQTPPEYLVTRSQHSDFKELL